MGCPYEKRPADCARRQAWSPVPNDCKVCVFWGRKPASKPETKTPAGETIRPAEEKKPAPAQTPAPKEETVATDLKERILQRIEKDGGRCSKSRLMAFIYGTVSDKEKALQALLGEGKVRLGSGARKGSIIVALASTPPPPEKSASSEVEKPEAKKRAGRTPRTRPASSIPPKNGGGRTGAADVFSPAIAELTKRRDRLDETIRLLQEERG